MIMIMVQKHPNFKTNKGLCFSNCNLYAYYNCVATHNVTAFITGFNVDFKTSVISLHSVCSMNANPLSQAILLRHLCHYPINLDCLIRGNTFSL